jgi:hypothetical protein
MAAHLSSPAEPSQPHRATVTITASGMRTRLIWVRGQFIASCHSVTRAKPNNTKQQVIIHIVNNNNVSKLRRVEEPPFRFIMQIVPAWRAHKTGDSERINDAKRRQSEKFNFISGDRA